MRTEAEWRRRRLSRKLRQMLAMAEGFGVLALGAIAYPLLLVNENAALRMAAMCERMGHKHAALARECEAEIREMRRDLAEGTERLAELEAQLRQERGQV